MEGVDGNRTYRVKCVSFFFFASTVRQGSLTLTNWTAITQLPALKNLNIRTSGDMSGLDFSITANLEDVRIFAFGMNHAPRFTGLTQLFQLYVFMSSTERVTYPEDMLHGLTGLGHFGMSSSSNGLQALPDISQCLNLYTLTVSDNDLTYEGLLSTNFSALPLLENVNFNNNRRLAKLPETLGGCSRLYNLDASNCNLNAFDSFFNFSDTILAQISVKGNNIQVLPEAFSYPPTAYLRNSDMMMRADLSRNPIMALPDSFAQLPFTVLFMSNTSIPIFPKALLQTPIQALYWVDSNVNMTMESGTSWNSTSWNDNMFSLDLSNLRLHSVFPNELKAASKMRQLMLNGNYITGTIDSDFIVDTLEEMDLSNNQIEGTFPSIASSKLETISASNNRFSSIPETISGANRLMSMDFSFNALDSIPSGNAWYGLPELGEIDLRYNPTLTGTVPGVLFSIPSVYTVNLEHCNFYGDLPPLNSSSLQYVILRNNRLNGTIAAPLHANSLRSFFVESNQLHGTIPSNFGTEGIFSANTLNSFDVSFNNLSGTFPTSALSLFSSSLYRLNLQHNQFSGPLLNFSILTNIGIFDGSGNQFDICAANPHFPAGAQRLSSCSVQDNLYPGACHCPSYTQGLCEADTMCPVTPTVSTPTVNTPTSASYRPLSSSLTQTVVSLMGTLALLAVLP